MWSYFQPDSLWGRAAEACYEYLISIVQICQVLILPVTLNPSPAEPKYTLPLQTAFANGVDPDQLASSEAN